MLRCGDKQEYYKIKGYLIVWLNWFLTSTGGPDNRAKSGELGKKVNRQF